MPTASDNPSPPWASKPDAIPKYVSKKKPGVKPMVKPPYSIGTHDIVWNDQENKYDAIPKVQPLVVPPQLPVSEGSAGESPSAGVNIVSSSPYAYFTSSSGIKASVSQDYVETMKNAADAWKMSPPTSIHGNIGMASVFVDEMTPPKTIQKPTVMLKPILPNLLSFVLSDVPFDDYWTNDRVSVALESQGWRERQNGETIAKGDLMHYVSPDGVHFERIQGHENLVLTEEHRAELMNYTVFTCEGGAPKRKPLIVKNTEDYRSIYEVPKGVKVNMPTSETEAARFFGCGVIRTDYMTKGKSQKVYYPIPLQMADRRFRAIFSRAFSDFTKTHFRECIKSVIPCRGEGFNINQMRGRVVKNGISTRKIRQMMEAKGKMVKGTLVPLTTKQLYDQIQIDTRLDTESIDYLLKRQDYQPPGSKISHSPFAPFLERMNERKLAPDEYRYDKALGIEIEAISTTNAVDLQRKMPHWVRTIYDGSLRDNKGAILRPSEALPPSFEAKQKELAKGMNGVWGVEFQLLIHRREMEAQINRVLGTIARCGCFVNKTCGLHIHFDMRDKTLEEAERIADKVNDWLMILRDLLPKERRHNKYCAFESPDHPHHAAVATDSYAKHKTIEVRVHSGTISPTKILHWIRLIDILIAARYTLPPKSSCLDALKVLDLTPSDREYWLKRHHQLNAEHYPTPPDLSFLGGVTEIE